MDARYSRQLVLPGFGEAAQQKLGAARVLVIGAGGLGSSVLPALAAAGVGTIGIVDDDTVELSNLHRQTIHGTADVGSPKVASAKTSILAINPVSVTTYEERLTADNALELFADYDLVVDGSDNFETRYLANDAAHIAMVPLVWGAVSQYGGQVSVAMPDGPNYRDLFPEPGDALSCEVGGVLPTTVGVIGSIMATEVLKLITGIGDPLIGRVTTYDAKTGRFREVEYRASVEQPSVMPENDSVTPAELATMTGITLIDVRETWEAEIAALPGALVIPLGALPEVVGELPTDGEYVVYCHHGVRSLSGLHILQHAGLRAKHLAGGIDAWSKTVDPEMARY